MACSSQPCCCARKAFWAAQSERDDAASAHRFARGPGRGGRSVRDAASDARPLWAWHRAEPLDVDRTGRELGDVFRPVGIYLAWARGFLWRGGIRDRPALAGGAVVAGNSAERAGGRSAGARPWMALPTRARSIFRDPHARRFR